MYANDSSIS